MVNSKTAEKVRKFIYQYELLEKNDKILVAFSGGPDSVFLFHCLNIVREEYNLEIELVYVNHNLRKDVYEDIEFVKLFSKKHNLTYYIKDIDIKEIASKRRISEEEAGREERYKVFSDILEENKLTKIATGHNLDDNIETFIFRLLRGTSLNGLKGIPVKRGNIIRPILGFRKDKILEILDNNNESYRIDSTNFELKYTRNKIRNLSFPLFEDINPLFREKISDLIDEINNLEKVPDKSNNKELELSKLRKLSKNEQNKKIFDLISMYDINVNREKIRQISGLIESHGNKEINLGNSFVLYKNYAKLEVISKKANSIVLEPEKLILGERLEWGNYFLELKELKELKETDNNESNIIYIERSSEIIVRSRKDGDKIYLKNLGYKKIKKIFIDEKVEKKDRELIPIIVIDDEIIAAGDIRFNKPVSEKELDEEKHMKLIIRRKNAK